MLAPVRPRSSWLRKLSLTLARSATSFSVWRRARRRRRSWVPTESAAGTGARRDLGHRLKRIEVTLQNI